MQSHTWELTGNKNIDSVIIMLKELPGILSNAEILEQTPLATLASLSHLLKRMAKLETQNAALEKRIEKLEARLMREGDNQWSFMGTRCVEPANNSGRYSFRFPVTCRKRNFGNQVGILGTLTVCMMSLRKTCRIQARMMLPVLGNTFQAWLNRAPPNLSFISV